MSLEPPNQSLRSHRQTANPHVMAAAVQKQKPYIQDSTHLQLPNVGDKDRERVGNMVKRRFSARIPGQGVPYDAAAAPSLPVGAGSMIDDAVAAGGVPVTKSKTMTSPAKAAPVASGASGMLLKEDLDAHTFVTQQLATSNAEEVDRFVSKLKSLKSRLVDEQREAMYTNYNSFLTVNKEILALNSEVKSLGQAVSNFNVAVSAMVEDALESTSSKSQESSQSSLALPDSSARNRNSMVMLENMWANELASLFKHVEGAVKYLPAIPGRHVVAESGAWYQLNAATWKPLRPVHMFLLNDHLLIAAKNRKRITCRCSRPRLLWRTSVGRSATLSFWISPFLAEEPIPWSPMQFLSSAEESPASTRRKSPPSTPRLFRLSKRWLAKAERTTPTRPSSKFGSEKV